MSLFYLKEPNAIFSHVPQTGGLTIRDGLWRKNYDGPLHTWEPEYDKMFSFAFVRHPLDRLVSAFYSLTEGSTSRKPQHHAMTLEQFCEITLLCKDPHKTDSIAHHTYPMSWDINYLAKVKFIGRYERYTKDLVSLMKHLGIHKKIPELHVSVRYDNWEDTLQPLSSEVFEQLVDFYREDFERFGYEMPTGR